MGVVCLSRGTAGSIAPAEPPPERLGGGLVHILDPDRLVDVASGVQMAALSADGVGISPVRAHEVHDGVGGAEEVPS